MPWYDRDPFDTPPVVMVDTSGMPSSSPYSRSSICLDYHKQSSMFPVVVVESLHGRAQTKRPAVILINTTTTSDIT